MKMYQLKMMSLIFASSLLIACGGGGGSASSDENVDTANVTASEGLAANAGDGEGLQETDVVEPDVGDEEAQQPDAQPVEQTSDLVADAGFLFKSNFAIRVEAYVSDQYDAMTVCKQSEAGPPDYERCLLRASLDEGVFNGEVLATNDVDLLLISLWDFSSPNLPQEQRWDLTLQGTHILLN